MRHYYSIFILVLVLLSCSKEEDIPFKESVKDSIDVISYRDISGVYKGTITNIDFISNDSYVATSPAKSHSVEISEISFDKVLCLDVSTDFSSNAEAEMFRFNQSGGYLRFLPYSMTDSTGIDSVYNNQFNGIYYYEERSLQYFMFFVEKSDTIHQVFEGKIN